jgi:hypothetical protein
LFARIGVIGAGVLVFLVMWWLTESRSGTRILAAAIAETDLLDPRWREEEIEADRKVVPEDKNGALQVPLIPDERFYRTQRWYPGKQWPTQELEEALRDLRPEVPLDQNQYRLLKANLDAVQPALAQARGLLDYSWGRYPLRYSKDGFSTMLPHVGRNRTIATLLGYDALRRSHEGDADGALDSCRAALNAGRSLGDEPFHVCQLVRMACRGVALERAERTLAHGQASEAALAKLERSLEEDEREPMLLRGCRSDRASVDRFMEAMERGSIPFGQLVYSYYWASQAAPFVDRLQMFIGISTRAQRSALLKFDNRAVEIARMPPEQQEQALADLTARALALPSMARHMTVDKDGETTQTRFYRLHHWQLARTRSAIAMLAIERYRLANGRWPESLEALIPAQLAQVPLDPYDGKPLRYRRLADGVTIYSVGPDLTDNGGKFELNGSRVMLWWTQSNTKGMDIGMRLWDMSHRGQPAKGH